MDVSLLLARYDEVAMVNEGRWFALSRDGELLAVASSEKSFVEQNKAKVDWEEN